MQFRCRHNRQGINFQDTDDVGSYAECFTVANAILCPKTGGQFDTTRPYVATLAFVAGPNAGCSMAKNGSTAMTLNRCAATDYGFFREAVKAAIASGALSKCLSSSFIDCTMFFLIVCVYLCGLFVVVVFGFLGKLSQTCLFTYIQCLLTTVHKL